jgi:hypothetical protein
MAHILDSPVAVKTLFREGGEGAGDASGWGASIAFHIGEGVGGNAHDLLPFLQFIGGTSETVTIGGVSVERIVPLVHPFWPGMVARAARWRRSGRAIDTEPGATGHVVTVDFAPVPYTFTGDQPYMTVRRRYGASAITLPGRAFAVSSVPLEHDVARVIPEVIYSATQYNVPTLDDSVFTTLVGKLNAATFLGYAAETVRFDGVEDEINTTIAFTVNRTVSLSLAWRPVSWNKILLPSGVWSKPINISDGLGIYELGNFDLLLG